jgi:hypothetical protein
MANTFATWGTYQNRTLSMLLSPKYCIIGRDIQQQTAKQLIKSQILIATVGFSILKILRGNVIIENNKHDFIVKCV